MVTFERLPIDILNQIIQQLDSRSQLTLGLASKLISVICIKQLWHIPVCKSIASLESILTTLNSTTTSAAETVNFYPYATWMVGLDISFKTMEKLPESVILMLNNLVPIPTLRTLRLDNIDSPMKTCHHVLQAFIQPHILHTLELCNCSSDVTISIANYLTNTETTIEKLHIKDSYLSDPLIKQMATYLPHLRYFRSEGSGYISDTSILAITSSCPLIETIIITLPNYLVQSNTITPISLEALTHCTHLTTFICKGQVRISSDESRCWLLEHCSNLKICDLSF